MGRIFLWEMNLKHSRLTDWGLSHVSIGETDTILDVGCGGGRTIRKMAALVSQGKVYGIDHSEASVAGARRTNSREIAASRVAIQHGSVSQLPFADNFFDLVTGVETHFFWPHLPADMQEVHRVLKPGGSLILIAEVYKGSMARTGRLAEKYESLMGMTLLTAAEHRELFETAGFAEVQVFEERNKGWICATGRKPGASDVVTNR